VRADLLKRNCVWGAGAFVDKVMSFALICSILDMTVGVGGENYLHGAGRTNGGASARSCLLIQPTAGGAKVV